MKILNIPLGTLELSTNFSTHDAFLGATTKSEYLNKLEDTTKDWVFLDENISNSTTKIVTANKTENAYSLLKYITRTTSFVGKDIRSDEAVAAQHHCKRLSNRSLVSRLFLFLSALINIY